MACGERRFNIRPSGSASITRRLVERFATESAPARLHRDLTPLTPRELEVLTLLGAGLSNAELARELTLPPIGDRSRAPEI